MSLVVVAMILIAITGCAPSTVEAGRNWYFQPSGGKIPTGACSELSTFCTSSSSTRACSALPPASCIKAGDTLRFSAGVFPVGSTAPGAFKLHGAHSDEIIMPSPDSDSSSASGSIRGASTTSTYFISANGRGLKIRGRSLIQTFTVDAWAGGNEPLLELWLAASKYGSGSKLLSVNLASSAGTHRSQAILVHGVVAPGSTTAARGVAIDRVKINPGFEPGDGRGVVLALGRLDGFSFERGDIESTTGAACIELNGGVLYPKMKRNALRCGGGGIVSRSLFDSALVSEWSSGWQSTPVEQRFVTQLADIYNNLIEMPEGVENVPAMDLSGWIVPDVQFNTLIGGGIVARAAGMRFTDATAIAYCATTPPGKLCKGTGAGYVDLEFPASGLAGDRTASSTSTIFLLSHNIIASRPSGGSAWTALSMVSAKAVEVESNVFAARGSGPPVFTFGSKNSTSLSVFATAASLAVAPVSNFQLTASASENLFKASTSTTSRNYEYRLFVSDVTDGCEDSANPAVSIATSKLWFKPVNYDFSGSSRRRAQPDAGYEEVSSSECTTKRKSSAGSLATTLATLLLAVLSCVLIF